MTNNLPFLVGPIVESSDNIMKWALDILGPLVELEKAAPTIIAGSQSAKKHRGRQSNFILFILLVL
jgi:hypothetical protein